MSWNSYLYTRSGKFTFENPFLKSSWVYPVADLHFRVLEAWSVTKATSQSATSSGKLLLFSSMGEQRIISPPHLRFLIKLHCCDCSHVEVMCVNKKFPLSSLFSDKNSYVALVETPKVSAMLKRIVYFLTNPIVLLDIFCECEWLRCLTVCPWDRFSHARCTMWIQHLCRVLHEDYPRSVGFWTSFYGSLWISACFLYAQLVCFWHINVCEYSIIIT